MGKKRGGKLVCISMPLLPGDTSEHGQLLKRLACAIPLLDYVERAAEAHRQKVQSAVPTNPCCEVELLRSDSILHLVGTMREMVDCSLENNRPDVLDRVIETIGLMAREIQERFFPAEPPLPKPKPKTELKKIMPTPQEKRTIEGWLLMKIKRTYSTLFDLLINAANQLGVPLSSFEELKSKDSTPKPIASNQSS
jgi:hypothetical protein